MINIIIFLLIWYITGCCGFIYWFTKDFDLTTGDIPTMLFAGLIGIFSWIIGYGLHGKHGKCDKILIKKKEK